MAKWDRCLYLILSNQRRRDQKNITATTLSTSYLMNLNQDAAAAEDENEKLNDLDWTIEPRSFTN